MGEASAKKELRIVLHTEATEAFEMMAKILKNEMATIKIQPSQFVSFLIADFFQSHFEKDKAVLLAEFFDSDAYFDAARKKAKGSIDYEDQMAKALNEAQKIRSKRRNKTLGTIRTAPKSKEPVTL